MPGRVDLRAVARGKECNASASRAECDSSFMSGWPVAPHYLHGFNRPCTWDGTHCATGERAPCASLHDWHRCPRLGETWLELSGHPSSGARSWTCTPNGEWPELGAINEPVASGRPGLGRLLAFSMSKEQCRTFPWRSRDVAWHAWGRQPAIVGLDNDVKRELPLQQQRHPRLQAGTVMRKDWMLATLRSRHPHCICSRESLNTFG